MEDKLLKEISQNIVDIRKKQGLTQNELSTIIGCSRGHLSCIELGRSYFSIDILYKLCFALKCNILDILPKQNSNLRIK